MKTAQKKYNNKSDLSIRYEGNDSHRFSLIFCPSNEKNPRSFQALFIGLNPSAADDVHSDNTVNYCLNIAKNNNWNSIVICNLISFRDPNSENLNNEEWLIESEENLKTLEKYINISQNIIAFWGDSAEGINNTYREKVFNLLKNNPILTIGLTKKNYPLHIMHRFGGERKITPKKLKVTKILKIDAF